MPMRYGFVGEEMHSKRTFGFRFSSNDRRVAAFALALATAACGGGGSSSNGAAGAAGSSGAAGTTTAACDNPGAATSGAADDHCMAKDGSMMMQSIDLQSCCDHSQSNLPAACSQGGSAEEGCAYGATQYGTSGYDDDCKYKVSWTSTPICEGSDGVEFTVTLTSIADGSPATGGKYMMEAFTTTEGDQTADGYCDNGSTHPSPTTASAMKETKAGSGVYKVKMQFDAPGAWTIRFHIHHNCADTLKASPHGHAAFHITVP